MMPKYQVQLSGMKGRQVCESFVTFKAKTSEEAAEKALRSTKLTGARVCQALELSSRRGCKAPF